MCLSMCIVLQLTCERRNFPQGTISDMVKDVSQGISFVCNHIVEYGGDPNRYESHLFLVIRFLYLSQCDTLCIVYSYRIYLMGQSAGAHISSCALLEQAITEYEGGSVSWSVSQIKAYFGLSGG